MPTKQRGDGPDIAPFQPGGAASASGDGTDEKSAGADFSLTDANRVTPRGPVSADAIDRPGVYRPGNVIQITTSTNASNLPPEQLAMLQQKMVAAGLLESTHVNGVLDDETRKALAELKKLSAGTGQSDLETLNLMASTRAEAELASGSSDSSGAAVDNSPSVSVSKTVTDPIFTDPMTARATLRGVMEQRLGRAPTSEEYDQFKRQLQSSESGQDIVTQKSVTRQGRTSNDSRTTQHVSRSDDTTDPSADVIADDMTRRGALGREANTVQAASYFDVIRRRIGES